MTSTSRRDERTRLGALGALLTAGLFTVFAGLPGLVAGLALLACWVVAPRVVTFAFGHLLVATFFAAPTAGEFAAIELGLLVTLLEPDIRTRNRNAVIATILTFGALAGLAMSARTYADSLLVAGLVLVGVAALLSYGLHRYELVRLSFPEGTE